MEQAHSADVFETAQATILEHLRVTLGSINSLQDKVETIRQPIGVIRQWWVNQQLVVGYGLVPGWHKPARWEVLFSLQVAWEQYLTEVSL